MLVTNWLLCGNVNGIIYAKFINYPLRENIEHLGALIPRDAYFGGCTNASVLYYKCSGIEHGYYLDVNSMYPFVMSGSHFFLPNWSSNNSQKGYR